MWQPLDTMPTSGEFLIAEYAPTHPDYRVVHIKIPGTMEGESRDRYARTLCRNARAWMPVMPAPTLERLSFNG